MGTDSDEGRDGNNVLMMTMLSIENDVKLLLLLLTDEG